MRTAFITTLTELAGKNKDIFLLTGDLGFSVFENFRKHFPERFFDVGVAEQNMIGIAAGLALSGKIVFVYSIIPFATMRCFEQIRNDLCMQNLNVKIIGMGAGLHYGPAGPTHHAIEDISIMRTLPNMTVISPSMPEETENVIRSAAERQGPVYIRLSRSYGSIECNGKSVFSIGKGLLIEKGNDITIISTGTILYNAKKVVDILKKEGVCTRLINIHTIKPIDKEIILKAARETNAVFTLEEHSGIGGLGSAVSEVLAESNAKVKFKRFALPDKFINDVGRQKYLLLKCGLSAEGIASVILQEFSKVKV
jgi:transketolase